MFLGMSAPEVWIESQHIKLSRGRLGGRVGEAAIIGSALLLAVFLPGWLGLHLGGAELLGLVGAPIVAMLGLAARRNIARRP